MKVRPSYFRSRCVHYTAGTSRYTRESETNHDMPHSSNHSWAPLNKHEIVDELTTLKNTCRMLVVLTVFARPDLLLAGPLLRKKCGGPYHMNTPDCFHPTRTVVIIYILLRTRAAMHTTIAAAAVWQFEATQNRFLYALIIMSIFLACYHVAKNEKKLCFCGAPFLWGPLFDRTCWTCPKSAYVYLTELHKCEQLRPKFLLF